MDEAAVAKKIISVDDPRLLGQTTERGREESLFTITYFQRSWRPSADSSSVRSGSASQTTASPCGNSPRSSS